MGFEEDVWEVCQKIPRGRVVTYGEVAKALGTKAYRAVATALRKNPYGAWSCSDERMVPCHRVVNSDGSLGGFALGADVKKAILKREGVFVVDGKIKHFEEKLFTFS